MLSVFSLLSTSPFIISAFLGIFSMCLHITLPFPNLRLWLSFSPIKVALFPQNEWCFCGRVPDCCRARGLECHLSRLIYPPPLSSYYAWSLTVPFLLFFPCYCSQVPPPALPRPLSLRFSFFYPAILQNTIHVMCMPQHFLAPSWLKYLKTCHVERPHELELNAPNICAPEKTSEHTSAITAGSFICLKNSGAALLHKPCRHAISYIINP